MNNIIYELGASQIRPQQSDSSCHTTGICQFLLDTPEWYGWFFYTFHRALHYMLIEMRVHKHKRRGKLCCQIFTGF